MVVDNAMREVIASIDIGSSNIKLVVGEMINGELNILCAIDEVSRGVKKGTIVEPEETEYAIKKILKQAEDRLGVKIREAIVSVSEESADFKIGEASITITNNDREVGPDDIMRVLQQSIKGQVDKEYELVTVIPIMFKVDDRKTRMPKNWHGDSLSVKSVIVSVPKRDVYTTAKVLEKCGVEVSDIMIDSIGSYYAHHNESTDTSTGVIIDVGDETMKIAVFNKGIIINNLVLGLGGSKIDSDMSFVYKLAPEQSRKIKESLALANKRYASSKEQEVVVNTEGEKVTINQAELTELTMSRLHELLNMAKNEINYFPLEIESVFGRIASMGKINIVGARDNKYAACVGMIKYFDYKLNLRDREYSIFNQDDLDTLCANSEKRIVSSDSLLGKVFGIFFDN